MPPPAGLAYTRPQPRHRTARNGRCLACTPNRRPDRTELAARGRAVGTPGDSRLGRAGGVPGLVDVPCDLPDQLVLAGERALVAQPLPELDDDSPAVKVARVVEEEG